MKIPEQTKLVFVKIDEEKGRAFLTMAFTAETDKELMERVKREDGCAFEELVERHKRKLFNLIYRMINDKEEAEDILQETFLRVYRERESFNPYFCFSTWVYTIALNLTKNQLKKKKRFRFLELSTIQDDKRYSREDQKEDSSLKSLLEEAIAKLPARYRMALVMRDIHQHSYEEMSQILQVPLGTIKSRVNRARSILRKRLKPELLEGYGVS